jgi:hypothetical protein
MEKSQMSVIENMPEMAEMMRLVKKNRHPLVFYDEEGNGYCLTFRGKSDTVADGGTFSSVCERVLDSHLRVFQELSK